MWWPRPRWKSDFLARFILLVSITATTTSNVVMADEGERCNGSDMSAVIWTMALCTMLLVLIVVVIYFVYCKKREHDWSSLWWKSNPDKNIVLQTSPPTNGQQQKIGGTDNPAFLADSCVVGRVTKTGLTKTVHVSSLNDGLLGAELSVKEENGRKIFLCKHNDGSKDRLVAVRLVFGNEQQLCGASSDLSRALVELGREYGLQVELETEGDAIAAPSAAVAGQNGDGPESHATKSNLLSAVRGTAQRLWHQRPFMLKSSSNGGGHADVRDQKNCSDDDVESGRVAVTTDAPIREQKSPCAVTTVDETAPAAVVQSSRNCNGKSLQYRTLEYGASATDDTAQSCPDSSIQCCVVNSSEPAAIMTVKATTVKSAAPDNDLHAVVTPVKDASFAVAVKDTSAAAVATVTAGDKDTTEKIYTTTIDGDSCETKPVEAMKNDNGPKHAAANPAPPPPPRKYSASVVSSVSATVAVPRAAAVITTSTASATATVTGSVDTVAAPAVGSPSTIVADTDPLPVVSLQQAPPVKTAPPTAENEIRIDDDYYWCTTTTMAAPMSSFGKGPSSTGAVSEHNDVRGTRTNGSTAVTAIRTDVHVIAPEKSAASVQMDDESAAIVMAAADIENNKRTPAVAVDDKIESVPADDADVNDDVPSRPDVTAVADGGTTSIEDASLPSFSSDEDVDDDDDDDGNDNGVDGKTQFSCGSAVTVKDAVVTSPDIGGCNGEATADEVRKGGGGNGHKPDVKADCNGESRNNEDGVAASVRVTADSKSPTKLPTLKLSLSSPLQSSTATTSYCSSSASSTSSTSSSPTNNGSNNNNSPIVSKIPVRRQSAGSTSSISNGGSTVSMSLTNNGSAKKSIPLPLSRSGSRLAMWSSVN